MAMRRSKYTADKANGILKCAISVTDIYVQRKRYSQDNDALDTIFDREPVHDSDGVYEFLYRIFALPQEIRELVWGFASGGDHKIRLPGYEPNGIISVMLALKDRDLSSEGVVGVWKSFHVEWEGGQDSRAWERFKASVIPHVRSLTINFPLTDQSVFDGEEGIAKTISWMRRRSRPGYRATYTWHLEKLHLVGLRIPKRSRGGLGGSGWSIWNQCPLAGCKHWSEHWTLNRLRNDGVEVTVETKHGLGQF
ncbi:hypothetical protein DHEL01_v203014 [Diaporthe helianthi]|uniref:Uncharacterized protein n=1 Tax=Diaporthe helianthi TaxID=158607 RepID=A0A2P5I7X4_DIAHE|nr:hypothetical protein DHEL01_v203014 [Diaporthe helianthi]